MTDNHDVSRRRSRRRFLERIVPRRSGSTVPHGKHGFVRAKRRVVDFGCDYCADDQNRFFGHLDQLGSDESRRMILLRCPRCGALYENTPKGPDATRRLTLEEAEELYPDVMWEPPDAP